MNSSFDFIGGIDYGYRNLSAPSESSSVTFRDDNELGKINYRIGLNLNQKITEKIFFKTGVRFVITGYKERKMDFPGVDVISDINTPVFPGGEGQIFRNFSFIELPIIVRYEFSKKKFTPFMELGVSPALYLSNRIKFITEINPGIFNSKGKDNRDFSTLHLVSVVSFGGNYFINEKLQLFAQPTFRYHFTRLIEESTIRENLWSLGLEFGVRKRIN